MKERKWYLNSKRYSLQLGFKLVKLLDLVSCSDKVFRHHLNSSLREKRTIKAYTLLASYLGFIKIGDQMKLWTNKNPKRFKTAKKHVSNERNLVTICPCLALFLISTMSFFSCACKPCLSLSISLIDLSSILLFSRRSSANTNHILLKKLKAIRITLSKVLNDVSQGHGVFQGV